MRIQIASDLHLEFGGPEFKLGSTGREVLILAGDINVGTKADKFILNQLEKSDVIYIFGNHEFYTQVLPKVRAAWAGPSKDRVNKEAKIGGYDGRLHTLDNRTVVINGTRFIGTTLWSDFEGENPNSMMACERGMNDFRMINIRAGGIDFYGGIKLTAYDVLHFHRQAVKFLEKKLFEEFDGPTVVITHMCPSLQSIPEAFKLSSLNGSFASDLDWLIEKYQPELWFHGHTHNSFDYNIGETRIVCNPRGYYPNMFNPEFKDDFYIDLENN